MMQAWLARLFRRVWSEIFVTGNIDRAGATQIAEHIEGLLKVSQDPVLASPPEASRSFPSARGAQLRI